MQASLEVKDTEANKRLWAVIGALARQVPQQPPIYVVRPRDPLEGRFFAQLLEDKSYNQMSYIDFLCQLHRHIQTKLAG